MVGWFHWIVGATFSEVSLTAVNDSRKIAYSEPSRNILQENEGNEQIWQTIFPR